MDSGDMSSCEMRQAQSNFPESPDLAAGCQNFFPGESFGLPDPVAADKCLDGQTNKKREKTEKRVGGSCTVALGSVGCVVISRRCQPGQAPYPLLCGG